MEGLLLDIGSDDRGLPGFVRVGDGPGALAAFEGGAGLPFGESTVAGIHCSHTLERLGPARAAALLRECRRVLEPGGVLRVVTTDLDRMVRAYLGDWRKQAWLKGPAGDWIRHRGTMLNAMMRDPARAWVYTEEELVETAGWAGFTGVRRRLPGRSGVPRLRDLEPRSDMDLVFEFHAPPRAVPADPLVSVLIPAYNPRFFEQALDSARGQTWRNLEILVSDDSPGPEIQAACARAAQADPRVRHSRNEPPLGAYANYGHCFGKARGEYVKFLNDDDVMEPGCVEQMARVLMARPGVALVTSRRRRVDADGQDLPDTEATAPPVAVDSVVEGPGAAGLLVTGFVNFVGEPSTALFRRADLEDALPGPLSFAGRAVRWNVDVAMWMHLLGKGDLVYLAATFSSFRQHGSQQSWSQDAEQQSVAAWRQMHDDALRLGFPAVDGWPSLLVRPLTAAPATRTACATAAQAMHARAMELHAGGRVDAAAALLRRATESDPGFAPAHLHLGLSLYALADYPAAVEALRRAIELDPRVPEPVKQLAENLRRQVEGRMAPVP